MASRKNWLVPMTVSELIEMLEEMPKDAEIFYMSGPSEGQIFADEIEPIPSLQLDGRVKL